LRPKGLIIILGHGIGEFFQGVTIISVWFKAIGLGSLNLTVMGSTVSRSLRACREEPVLSTNHKWSDDIFSHVVIRSYVVSIGMDNKPVPLIQGIGFYPSV